MPPAPPKKKLIGDIGNFMEKREVRKTVRFSREEVERLEQIANAKGITLSDLIRRSVLKIPIPERMSPEKLAKKNEALREVAYELNKIGINVNQIARYCNKNREVDALVLEKLIQIERKLEEIFITAYESLIYDS